MRRRWSACMAGGLLLVPVLFIPAVDLTVSGWFYDPVSQMFPARLQPFPEWVRLDMPRFLFAGLAGAVLLWLAGLVLRRSLAGMTHRVIAYLLLSLALGPGLLVNWLLKDHWGRPRPSTLTEFGGSNPYVPPFVISDFCERNCSFSSGHGALGFWMVAVALLAPARWRRAAVMAALLWGSMVGLVRIAQGGHFLSDVIVSALITIGCAEILRYWLLAPRNQQSQKNNHFPDQKSP